MGIAAALAAFVAWLGASTIVLSDGRRGLALGLAAVSAGMAFLAWGGGGAVASAAIAAGGLLAAAVRARSGPPGWRVMPAGSTPRLVLCVAAALLALWIAASVTTGDGAPVRFAALCVVVQMGARLLSAREPAVIVTAVAALALAIGDSAALAASGPGPAPYVAAGLVAAGLMFVRPPAPHVA